MSEHIPLESIEVAHLFPEMRAELLRILDSLTDAEWQHDTACAGWAVPASTQPVEMSDDWHESRPIRPAIATCCANGR